MNSGIIYNF